VPFEQVGLILWQGAVHVIGQKVDTLSAPDPRRLSVHAALHWCLLAVIGHLTTAIGLIS
jgi:hypothetical protein